SARDGWASMAASYCALAASHWRAANSLLPSSIAATAPGDVPGGASSVVSSGSIIEAQPQTSIPNNASSRHALIVRLSILHLHCFAIAQEQELKADLVH